MPALPTIAAVRLAELSPEQVRALLASTLLVGAVYCFLGYYFVRFTVGMTGFLLAGSMAAVLAGFVFEGRMLFMAVAGVLGGIAGAAALFFVYKVGLFCVGALGCAVAAHMALVGRPDDWVPSAIVAASVFGGLAALVFERGVMILATSAVGAWTVCYGVLCMLAVRQDIVFSKGSMLILLAAWSVLAIIGSVTQFALRPRER